MKILSVFVLLGAVMLLAIVSQNAFAQPENAPGVTPIVGKDKIKPVKSTVESRLNSLSKQLALTAEQQAAIKPILEDGEIKLKALRDDTGLNTADHKAKIHELREATSNRIRSTLTPEQQQKYDAQRKEARERRLKKDIKKPQ